MFLRTSLLLLTLGFSVLGKTKLTPEERRIAEKQCVEEVNIDYNVILSVSQTLTIPDDVEYKSFLHCYYKKQGYQFENGTIAFGEILELLQEGNDGYTLKDAEKIIFPCKSLIGASGELAVLVLKCILNNLPENEIN